MHTHPTNKFCLLFAALAFAFFLGSDPSLLAQELDASTFGRPLEGNKTVDVDALTQRAHAIARGIVSKGQVKWIGRTIYTEYDLNVQETLKGPARNHLTVALQGGTIGNVELVIPGRPQLADGDEIVFFGERFDSGSSFTPVGTFDGIVAVSHGRGKGTTVALRGKPEDLDAFLDEVRGLGRKP
jgi:hypothetical protein